MDSRNKLHSEEDLSTDRKYQTSSNNMTSTFQNILNSHCKPITVYKNNKIPKINIRKAKQSNSIKSKLQKKSMESQTALIQKMEKQKSVPKTSPYSFKYFYNITNKKRALNNSSLGINSIKENNDMESNFISLSKNANIYTSNAEYIQNKKMLLYDKTTYDNNNYKFDRANIFNMTNIPLKQNKNSTLYKTTMFRGGKLYFKKKEEANKKLDYFSKEKFKKNVKNKFYENMPIDNMIEFIEQNKENLFPKITKKSFIIGDDSQEKDLNNYAPYNSLYKKIMSKKDEIFDNFINNKIDDYNKIIISHHPHQRNYSNFNNSSTMNPQNNSIETNILNNSSSRFNNSSNKINNRSNRYNNNNSSKNITNLSGYSNLLLKKNNDGIPIIFPIVCSTFAKCNSVSQSSRYQNIMDNFIKIKTLIENDKSLGKNNEFDYINEFLLNKKIDKKHINPNNLINFSKFLQCDVIPIDLNKSLKENILIGLYYNENNSKINSQMSNEKTDYSSLKNAKHYRNKILLNHNKIIKNNFNKNKINYKSLVLDLPRQKKLYKKEEDGKNNCKLKDELQKEINIIENEIQNKQNIIKQVEKKLYLTPLYYNYFNNIKLNKKKKQDPKSIDLRLVSTQDINKSKFIQKLKNEKNMNTNGNIYDSNERLYYSWYRNKKKGDINNFVKRTKLTEFIMYNKTKEKLLYGTFDEFMRNNSID